METWKATIKEKGNEHILTPTYSFSDTQFPCMSKEDKEREQRRFLIDFWGLNNPDVEWFNLYKL